MIHVGVVLLLFVLLHILVSLRRPKYSKLNLILQGFKAGGELGGCSPPEYERFGGWLAPKHVVRIPRNNVHVEGSSMSVVKHGYVL